MQSEHRAGTSILTIRGELDIACEEAFETEVAKVMPGGPDTVLLDLRELTFIDSTGLKLLLRLHQRAQRSGVDLAILRAEGPVGGVLAHTGLDSILPVVEYGEEMPT
jgi:anti-anti-sigma factor